MKKWFLLMALTLSLAVTAGFADDKGNGDDLLRKSKISEPNPFVNLTSFPFQFNETSNAKTNPAVSTGYYFVDNDDDAPDFWQPYNDIVDTNDEPTLWRRIVPGPRVLDPSYWAQNPDEGKRFFHNPANGDFFNHENVNVDSTMNAIAGPIPIGFGFYFNGLRYDSFYVSTTGCIALTNRRYFYNANGERVIPPSGTTAYDPMSMDWYARGRTGDGLTDPTPDDFGWRYSVLGNNITNTTGGIRSNGGSLNSMSTTANRGAYIAPFWGPLHLSQYNPVLNMAEDYGKVYFKRSINADKLIIYFVNIMFKNGGFGTLGGTWNNSVKDRRPGPNYVAATAHVVLNRTDSSITMVYDDFVGLGIVSSYYSEPANNIFRINTTAGVTGWARHVNWDSKTNTSNGTPWGGEYQQTTHYFSNYSAREGYPHNQLRVKYKQWKNAVRVVDIQYRVRKQDANADDKFSEKILTADANNYELLAGESRIGALQPVALIQNLTNDIQGPNGVNYVPQDLVFRARFRIVNQATDRIVYNRLINITKTCLDLATDASSPDCGDDPYNMVRYSSPVTKSGANYNPTNVWPLPAGMTGIPPYGFVQVYFPPFEPNEFVSDHIGRMKAFIIADPTDPVSKEGYGDEWPFDDTASVNLFVMNRLKDFTDDVTEFHEIDRVNMPSVYKWVNEEAIVTGGDDVSLYPLPPRGNFKTANKENKSLQSPVIWMNRKTIGGANPNPQPGGDQIRSFPIDLRNRKGAVLSLSIQRTQKAADWPRGWSDGSIVGCEPRAVVSQNPFTVYNNFGNPTDQIVVELMRPSPDGIQFITNVKDVKRWQYHPRQPLPDGTPQPPVENLSALAVYGSGGYFTGFNEANRNEPLTAPALPNLNGLRPNIFDDGIDFEYKKYFIAIPDTFITAPAEGAKNFRFRIRVLARDHQISPMTIPDDDDDFFVDNVRILFPSEITDIEVSTVKIFWPFTSAPASQATDIPVRVKLSNNTEVDAPTFTVKVKIFRGTNTDGTPVYCRTFPVSNLVKRQEIEVPLPNWNARRTGPGQYRLQAIVIVPNGDLEPKNDTTYSDVNLRFSDAFTYDPINNPKNDVPENSFTGVLGAGLTLFGFAEGGTSAANSYLANERVWGAGTDGGNGSGQIAAKFELLQTDTIYGFQVLFGDKNQAMDDISFSIYSDQGDQTPGQLIAGSTIYRFRGLADNLPEPKFNEYITYSLPKPVVLNKNKYWVSIAQLGETGFELGASKSRMGMRTTSQYVGPDGRAGTAGIQVMIDKAFRKKVGNNLINNNYFAFENVKGYGQWVPFMPTSGNPAYAHLHHFGTSPVDGQTQTMSRGTWIPMVRPFLKAKGYGQESVVEICDDDVPVELTSLNSAVRRGAIDLFWETASETNNYGFYVERRINGDNEDAWKTLGFVKGAGNSSSAKSYNFTDREVKLNTTYDYRLRQVDADGSQSCSVSDIETAVYTVVGDLTLENNYPNPITGFNTTIGFNLPTKSQVKLEVLDLLGNVVKTLINGELDATYHVRNWDTRDNNSNLVPAGTYIYRLSAGETVVSNKMTVIR